MPVARVPPVHSSVVLLLQVHHHAPTNTFLLFIFRWLVRPPTLHQPSSLAPLSSRFVLCFLQQLPLPRGGCCARFIGNRVERSKHSNYPFENECFARRLLSGLRLFSLCCLFFGQVCRSGVKPGVEIKGGSFVSSCQLSRVNCCFDFEGWLFKNLDLFEGKIWFIPFAFVFVFIIFHRRTNLNRYFHIRKCESFVYASAIDRRTN